MMAFGPTEWNCSRCGNFTTARANNNCYHPWCQKCQRDGLVEIMSWLEKPRKMVDGDLWGKPND